jgi:triacylglycerol lipase
MAFPQNIFQQFQSNTTLWQPNNALALGWAADLSYENNQTITNVANGWGFKPPVIISGPRDTQAIVIGNSSAVVIVFRGTVSEKEGRFDANNWIVDLDAQQIPVDQSFGVSGYIHEGFANAFASLWQPIQAAVTEFQDNAQSLWITGHSLGGALAMVTAAAVTFEKRWPFNGLYTFGQPRVGDPNFCGNCDIHFGDQYYRFVNDQDIVTRVPPRLFPHFPTFDTYGHCGRLVYFDANGQPHSDEHYWNTFLASVEVGLQGMTDLAKGNPVSDHHMETGYLKKLTAYVSGGCQPPLQW